MRAQSEPFADARAANAMRLVELTLVASPVGRGAVVALSRHSTMAQAMAAAPAGLAWATCAALPDGISAVCPEGVYLITPVSPHVAVYSKSRAIPKAPPPSKEDEEAWDLPTSLVEAPAL